MVSQIEKIEARKDAFAGIAYASGEIVSTNKNINHENVLQYEFYNFSNVPVTINGMFLDRYYSGSSTAPTVIPGSICSWLPSMISGEIDTSIYVVQFLDTYYPAVGKANAVHKLIVMRKGMAIIPGNR
jgi:hypothetical protein